MMAASLMKNGDTSSINKTRFLKERISFISAESLSILLDHGFVSSARQMDALLNMSSEKGRTEITALLMDYRNRNFDSVGGRSSKPEKLAKELNIAPESVSELKKKWAFQKKEDGSLVITGYKGDETEVVVPSRIGKALVTEIGAETFSPRAQRIKNEAARETITKIIIPDTVETVGNSAFAWCKNLTEIVLPDSITSFGSRVFLSCVSLKELKLPKNMKGTIRWHFFGECISIKKLCIPEGVTRITEFSFLGCDSLAELHCTSGLLDLESSSLEACSNVTVFAPEDSYAISYAQKYNLKYAYEL